jgi:hypothetical protein
MLGVVAPGLAHQIDGVPGWLLWAETWDAWARSTAGTPCERESAMRRADAAGLLGFVALVATRA